MNVEHVFVTMPGPRYGDSGIVGDGRSGRTVLRVPTTADEYEPVIAHDKVVRNVRPTLRIHMPTLHRSHLPGTTVV
jgi:hypothetical protein